MYVRFPFKNLRNMDSTVVSLMGKMCVLLGFQRTIVCQLSSAFPSKIFQKPSPEAPPLPQQLPRPWQRHKHFVLLNPGYINKPSALDSSSYHRTVSKPAQRAPGAQFLVTVPLCFWIIALGGIATSWVQPILGPNPLAADNLMQSINWVVLRKILIKFQ